MQKSLKAFAATAAIAVGTTTLAITGAPVAEAVTRDCPASSWCIYKHKNYDVEIWTGSRTAIDIADNVASSLVNNTGKHICLYDQRPGIPARHLVKDVLPYKDIPNFAADSAARGTGKQPRGAYNDRVDYVQSQWGACSDSQVWGLYPK